MATKTENQTVSYQGKKYEVLGITDFNNRKFYKLKGIDFKISEKLLDK